jgi:drug/metabolite transporter (DMT)-like permease
VNAILGGIGAALAFAAATLCSARSSRMIGPGSVLAWVMLVGLAIVLPLVIVGDPPELSGDMLRWLALSGGGNVLGLLLAYAGLRVGKVGVVAPILSTEGAIAALIALVAGERLASAVVASLLLIALGIVLAASGRDVDAELDHRDETSRAVAFALAAALSFGLSLYATGHVSGDLPLAWVLLPARVAGVAAVGIPLAVTMRLRMTRRATPLVVAAGCLEVAGFASFVLGARHGIAVAAVLSSQFAALAALAAYLLFRERLTSVQIAGVVVIAVGVAVLSGLQV